MAAYNPSDVTLTTTFGDQSENHVGMEKNGIARESGLTNAELNEAKKKFQALGLECIFLDLTRLLPADVPFEGEASLLIIRNGVSAFGAPKGSASAADQMLEENLVQTFDTQYWDRRRGKVLNKHARYNNCIGDVAQVADIANKKGTIVPFSSLPVTNEIRKRLPEFLGEKVRDLVAENNLYYSTRCYIQWHPDKERKIVVACRLGRSMQLHFRWYYRFQVVSRAMSITLNHGDMYVMSAKAVGTDGGKSSIPTLRHAAGDPEIIFK